MVKFNLNRVLWRSVVKPDQPAVVNLILISQSWLSWAEWLPSCVSPSPTYRSRRTTAARLKTDPAHQRFVVGTRRLVVPQRCSDSGCWTLDCCGRGVLHLQRRHLCLPEAAILPHNWMRLNVLMLLVWRCLPEGLRLRSCRIQMKTNHLCSSRTDPPLSSCTYNLLFFQLNIRSMRFIPVIPLCHISNCAWIEYKLDKDKNRLLLDPVRSFLVWRLCSYGSNPPPKKNYSISTNSKSSVLRICN